MKISWGPAIALTTLAILLVLPPPAAAQSAEELAKQTQNPIANLISVPLQANWDFGIGDRGATSTLLNFQPVVPFAVSRSTNLVLRIIMPLTSQPGAGSADPRINGMGDTVATAFFSPSKAGRIIWGVGPVVLLPTATNNALGTEKFGVGPSAVVLLQPGKWTLGLLFNQIWSTSGASNRTDVPPAICELQLRQRAFRGRQHGGVGKLEGGPEVDGAAALQRQQGHAARQAAREPVGGRRPDGGQPGRGRQLAVSCGGDLPLSTVTELVGTS
jgi:hypothetical protein